MSNENGRSDLASYETILAEVQWSQALLDMKFEGWTNSMSALLRTEHPIPANVREYLASMLDGRVHLPDGRGKKNTKLSPSNIREIQSALFGLYLRTETVLIFSEALADERGEEVLVLRRYIEGIRQAGVKKIASRFHISVHTARKYHEAKYTLDYAWMASGCRDVLGPNGEVVPKLMGDPAALKSRSIESARAYLQNPDLWFDPLPEPDR